MKTEIVASFPAYDIVKPNTDWMTGLPVFKDNDTLALEKPRFYKIFTIGSVVSFAIENNNDPIESYKDAVERGHKTHWLNANAVSITSGKREKETHFEINIDDLIVFEGIIFKVEKDWNDNLKLTKVCSRREYAEKES